MRSKIQCKRKVKAKRAPTSRSRQILFLNLKKNIPPCNSNRFAMQNVSSVIMKSKDKWIAFSNQYWTKSNKFWMSVDNNAYFSLFICSNNLIRKIQNSTKSFFHKNYQLTVYFMILKKLKNTTLKWLFIMIKFIHNLIGWHLHYW